MIEVQSQDLSESARPGVHGQPNTGKSKEFHIGLFSFHRLGWHVHLCPFYSVCSSCIPLDTAYVRIFVSDVNDNAPAFPRSVYEVSIDEDRDVGTPVVTATANDEDEGEWTLHVF